MHECSQCPLSHTHTRVIKFLNPFTEVLPWPALAWRKGCGDCVLQELERRCRNSVRCVRACWMVAASPIA